MNDIEIHEYKGETGYRGYVQPLDKSWILFIGNDGTPEFYPDRDPETGAILTAEDLDPDSDI